MGIYLSKPNTAKESGSGDTDRFKFGYSAMQGWRMSMEDAHIVRPDLTPKTGLFAIFDGHGGAEVAKFCAKYFPETLMANEKFKAEKYKEALEETFLAMDEMLMSTNGLNLLKEFKNDTEVPNSFAGCTANVVLITKTEIYVANAGDSRAYLYCVDGTLCMLSADHKPDLEKEKDRIIKAGGYVSEGRVNDNLNLSRALGDLEYKKNPSLRPDQQIISAFPDVTVKPLDKNCMFILMGCDGVWETMQAKDIAELASIRMKQNTELKLHVIVEELLDKLIGKDTVEGFGCDNMSCVLVQFK